MLWLGAEEFPIFKSSFNWQCGSTDSGNDLWNRRQIIVGNSCSCKSLTQIYASPETCIIATISRCHNWPNSQIPEYTSSISHNAPFRTEMCTFLFWIGHYGIWNRCILGFVELVYSSRLWRWGFQMKTTLPTTQRLETTSCRCGKTGPMYQRVNTLFSWTSKPCCVISD